MLKKLFGYMKGFGAVSVLGPFFKLTEACFELIVPLVVAQIIDKGISAGDTAYIWSRGAVLLALGLLGLFFSITAQYFAAKASVGVSGKIRRTLFEKSTQLSAKQLDSIGSAALLQRLTGDMDKVQSGLNLALRLMLRSPFVVVGAMIMAFTVDVKSAVIFAVVIPLLAIAVFGIMAVSVPLFAKNQSASDTVTQTVKENLEGARVIRAFGREESENKRFSGFVNALTESGFSAAKVSALTNPLTSVLINGALMVLIYRGSVSVDTGAITQGQLVALVNYMSQILVELIKLANLIVSVTKAVACFERVQKVIESEPETSIPKELAEAAADNEAVRFDNVSFSYSGGADSLSGISFCAMKGQTIGIVGPTGSGKSTLCAMIQGLYTANQGAVYVDGRDVRSYEKTALRSMISVVAQNPMLFSGSIESNIRFGMKDADETEIRLALETAQGSDIIKKKKDGLSAEAGQGGKNLSGGQKQRIALARAFIKKSDIIILDDSASALDMKTDAALRRAIHDSMGGSTVFIVSQRASSVRNADNILVMDDGRLVAQGTHDQLITTCALYKEIYECQFPEGEKYA